MTIKLGWIQLLMVSSVLILSGTPACAQITPDRTLGAEGSRLTPNVQIKGASAERIDGGAQRASNLFHSFSQFNINNDQRVYFVNPNGVQNILTRVTGKSASNILGTLGVFGNANLFLLNPNGILFGRNARLDLGGSFVGTTANAIRFGEQGIFSATVPQAPPLLTVNPSALLFNQLHPEAITNQSQVRAGISPAGQDVTGLRVPDTQSLLLVGGNINLDGGGLRAYSGNIELAGLAAPGNVSLNQVAGNNLSLAIPDGVERADVSLSNQAQANVRGAGGGTIKIQARNVNMAEDSGLRAGIDTGLGTPNSLSGNIEINATGATTLNYSTISNVVQQRAFGKAGNINIKSGSFTLRNDAQLTASTLGQGNAGSVFIQASDAASLTSASILSSVESGGVGNGGVINIQARSLTLSDGTQLVTLVRQADETHAAGRGNAGNVNVDVQGALTITGVNGVNNGYASGILSRVETGATGNGGNINIKSGSLALSDGARLIATTLGQGDAGSVFIQVSDAVSLTGKDTAIFSNVDSGGVGNGGDINIKAGSLTLTDGAELQTSVNSAFQTHPSGRGKAGNVNIDAQGAVTIAGAQDGISSGISSDLQTGATGNGGNISIKSGSFTLRDGAQLSASTFGQGDAGSVFIQASDAASLAGTTIFSTVESGGVGKGGNINIQAGSLTLSDDAQLLTSVKKASELLPAGRGNAGNVNIDVRGAVSITGRKDRTASAIFSSVGTGATGNGGDIKIESGSFSISDGAQLITTTFGQGNAGSVFIQAAYAASLAGQNTAIFSTVESGGVGKGGNINIQAGSLTLSDGAQLLTSVAKASETLPGGRGNAGNVNIDVRGAVSITGRKDGIVSAIFSSVETGATGNGGDIEIQARSLSLSDGAELATTTSGKGDTVAALTNSGNGGNITLTAADFLLLRRNSSISTTAGLTQSGGDGGNITIHTPFVVALPQENSHIRANAYTGKGGNVSISAQGIFGIQALKQPTLSSDITASSQLGVQGQIAITQSEVQPTQGLVALPGIVLDASNQIAQTCPKGTAARPLGEFIVSGRGSLPPNPMEPLAGTPNLSSLATLGQSPASAQPIVSTTADASPPALVEAQGWIKDSLGTIVLVASAPEVTPSTRPTTTVCPAPRQ